MAELTVRLTGNDVAMLRRWNAATATAGRRTPASPWPDRVILDITTAIKRPELALVARQAGVPVLVDPLTHLWQDQQWAGHPWAALPYGFASKPDTADLSGDEVLDDLVAHCFTAQLDAGATALLAPYVHLTKGNSGWLIVQLRLWQAAARWRADSGIALPLTPVVALDWQLLAYDRWPSALLIILNALDDMGAGEVFLAASKVDDGKTAADRLDDMLSVVELMSRRFRVTAMRQGVLGEACTIAGAAGYETGIGWGERCDLRNHMSTQRVDQSGHPVRPKYFTALGQSLAPRTLSAALTDPHIAAALTCMDPICCPEGQVALAGDMRDHTVRRRLAELALVRTDHPRWAWRALAERASAAADLADRINTVAVRQGANRTRTHALRALALVAWTRAETAPRRRGVA